MCVYYVYQFFPDDCMIYGSLVFHRRRFHQDFPYELNERNVVRLVYGRLANQFDRRAYLFMALYDLLRL